LIIDGGISGAYLNLRFNDVLKHIYRELFSFPLKPALFLLSFEMEKSRGLFWVLSERGKIYERLEQLVKERWPDFADHLKSLEKDRVIYVNQFYSNPEERKAVERALKELRGMKNDNSKDVYLRALLVFMQVVGDKEEYDEKDFERFLDFLAELPTRMVLEGKQISELEIGNRRRLFIECIKKFYRVNGWKLPDYRLRRLRDQLAWSYNEGESYRRIYAPEEIAEIRELAMRHLERYPQTVAMLMLVSDVGLRPIELIHLLEKDVNLEEGLLVRKAAKRGTITEPWKLHPQTIKALKYWLQVKRRRGYRSPFLFVSPKTKKPYSRSDIIDRKLGTFVEDVLEWDWRGCYAFRRANVTLIAEAIPPSMRAVKSVIKLFGWKTERTFLKYVKDRSSHSEISERIFTALHRAKS